MATTTASTMRSIVKSAIGLVPLKPLVFGALRRVIALPEKVYRHLHFQGPIRVSIDGKRFFAMYHWGNQIENDIFWAGLGNNWEATSIRLWLRLAEQAAVVLDIGANTGVFALAAQAVNSTAKVFAFEPVERVHNRLVRNIAANGFAIEAVCAGASNSTGRASFYDVPSEHVHSASLERSMLADRSDMIETNIEVVRLDDFMTDEDTAAPMLVKIDTERHELQVLQGFGKLIEEVRPTFMVEILDRAIGAEVARMFDGLDYAFFEVHEGEGVQPATELGRADRNYLICPRDVARRFSLEDGVAHAALAIC